MNKNKNLNPNTCMYCNSTGYGHGCPFGPDKIHIHPNDSKKCIYCGSTGVGMGCPFNPHGKQHVHGIDFNSMIKDSVQHATIVGYIIEKINKPVDEPKTLIEKFAKNLRQLLGLNCKFIKDVIRTENKEVLHKEEFVKQYSLELEAKKDICDKLEELRHIIEEKHLKGVPLDTLEKIIIDNFNISA